MPNPVEVYLMRHGESTGNLAHCIAGWSDVPLSELGEQQAHAAREYLEELSFDEIWASDLQRARTTARLAYAEALTDSRLRELNCGSLEGLPIDTLSEADARGMHEFIDWHPEGGERISEMLERVLDFLDELRERGPKRSLVVCHGGVIRVLLRHWGASLEATDSRVPFLFNGGVVRVRLDQERVEGLVEMPKLMELQR